MHDIPDRIIILVKDLIAREPHIIVINDVQG